MNKEDKIVLLLERLESNFETFKNNLMEKDKEYIISRAYETTIKKELVALVEEEADSLSEVAIDDMLEMSDSLSYLYNEYLRDDSSNVINELRNVINNL